MTKGLGFGDRLLTSSRGLGFGDRLLTMVIIMGFKCINLAKNGSQQRRAGYVAEWTRVWAGRAEIMGSNPAWGMNFFFFLLSKIF